MTILGEYVKNPAKKIDLTRTEEEWAKVINLARQIKVYHGVYPVVPSRKRKKRVALKRIMIKYRIPGGVVLRTAKKKP